MTPSEAIATLLAADATTTATRGDRYFGTTQLVPEGTVLPYQVCTELDSDFNHHLVANANVARRSMQLDHFAVTEEEVVTLADAARKALDAHRGIVTDSGTGKSLDVKGLRIQDEATNPTRSDSAQASGISRITQGWLMTFTLA